MIEYPYVDDEGSIVFSAKAKAAISWPVRIAGMQGLWRYVGPLPRKVEFTISGMEAEDQRVEVIGPYFPGNSARNGGRSRIMSINHLKYAGKSAKPVDVISVETQALSNEAKRARRR